MVDYKIVCLTFPHLNLVRYLYTDVPCNVKIITVLNRSKFGIKKTIGNTFKNDFQFRNVILTSD